MEQAVTQVLAQSPVALVLFWMVLVFNKKDEEKARQLDNLHTKIIGVVENNTKAMTEVTSTVKENTKATETLSDRIYDVLTNRIKK